MKEIPVEGLNPTLFVVLLVFRNKIGSTLFKLDKIMRVPRMMYLVSYGLSACGYALLCIVFGIVLEILLGNS